MIIKVGFLVLFAGQNLPLRRIVYLAAFFTVVLGVYGQGYDLADLIHRG
jgi:disulfide bond formation protein DsbB